MEDQKEYPECSVYAIKNTRRLMEDRHVVIPNLVSQLKEKGDNRYSYYAIFDGHAGPDAAQFAADTLHQNLVDCSFFKSGNISDAFRYAYATTDFQYTEKSLSDGIKAGCTAVTCVLENRSRLYLAWVGDSVAILSRNGKPCFITEPHNLERDDEKERVVAMGGTVLYFDTWRVNGTLGVSRAIGDPEYKPYVCADPDIECIELDGSEDFLIIGCDGLWDRMTPEDAIGLIYEHLSTNSHLGVNELVNSTAQILADKSIKDGSSDNVTTIVLFLKDVASILNSSSSSCCYIGGSSINGSNNHKSNGNGNDNGFEYDERLATTTTAKATTNDLMGSENVGEAGSTLNPFADEFQPNICSSNMIGSGDGGGEVGNEPKKDDDEESHKNEKSDKKDSWMSDFTDDGNNYHHQHHQHQHHQHQQQHDHEDHDQHDTQLDQMHADYPKKKESGMFDGLMGNGLSDSVNLSFGGYQQSASNLSSSEYEDNLSSEMIIHEIDETKSDTQQQPSAPELLFIEQQDSQQQQRDQQQQQQYQHQQQQQQQQQQEEQEQEKEKREQSNLLTIESNLISQAETFVGNLTPNEVPSSPVNEKVSATPNDNECGFTFDTQSLSSEGVIRDGMKGKDGEEAVNQYITSVSDGMVSEPYHDGYFASDGVEPESIIVNRGGDVISSGPHAIDPYSGKGEDKIEFDSIKGGDDDKGGERKEDNDDENLKEKRKEKGEEAIEVAIEEAIGMEDDALNSSGKINIEDTQSIPLESLNPFDGGNNDANEFGVDIGPGDETKSSYYTDNPDNSCGLLDFSDDQVNTIMITPNSSGYLLNESKLMEESGTERGLSVDQLEQQLSEQKKMDKEGEEDDEEEKEKEKGEEKLDEKKEEKRKEDGMRICEAEEKIESSSCFMADKGEGESLVKESDENGIPSQGGESVASTIGIVTASAAAAATVTAVGAVGAGVGAIGSKINEQQVKKDSSSKTVFSKTPAVKKSTLPTNKTAPPRSGASLSSGSGTTTTRKPLATGSAAPASRLTSSIRSTSSSTTSKLSTSRQPTSTSTSTTSTSNVKNSSSTSRVGTASTLNKRPTQTLTSSTSRVSSLASSRTTTSTSSRSATSVGAASAPATSKPLARTTTSTTKTSFSSSSSSSAATTTNTGLASRRPLTSSLIKTASTATSSSTSSSSTRAPLRSTLTSRIGSTSTRAPTSSSSTTTTASKPSTISSTSTTKTVASKRDSTGSMLSRPSPGASLSSSSTIKSTSSALNRSLTKSSTSSSSSRPGASSTLSKTSTTRPTTASSNLSSFNRLTKSTTAPSKPTTSTNKVAVPRLGLNKKASTPSETTPSNDSKKVEEGSGPVEVASSSSPLISVATGDEGNPTPVDGITSSSMKREKNVNSANSLKDELEAALASPISCEEKGVITKEDESSGNL